ncbi:MAG TPA: hypothetical protein VJU86_06360 [Pyrinomonadaceae bacterium]|nr:hypothetical protein [Pyrinomonadaceae bacterium]
MITKRQQANLICYVLCVLACAIAPGLKGAAGQPSEPKTVEDFFLLVPERYMDGYDLGFRREVLRGEHRGVVVDITNGYISYDASDNPSGFEFAIFRKNDGGYLVAYSTGAFSDPEMDRELGNWPILFLLSYEGGKWRDVTKSLLP